MVHLLNGTALLSIKYYLYNTDLSVTSLSTTKHSSGLC